MHVLITYSDKFASKIKSVYWNAKYYKYLKICRRNTSFLDNKSVGLSLGAVRLDVPQGCTSSSTQRRNNVHKYTYEICFEHTHFELGVHACRGEKAPSVW